MKTNKRIARRYIWEWVPTVVDEIAKYGLFGLGVLAVLGSFGCMWWLVFNFSLVNMVIALAGYVVCCVLVFVFALMTMLIVYAEGDYI